MKKNWPIFLFLILLVLATYGNSLNNAFLSDDIAEIVQNPNIGNIANISTSPFGFIRLLLYWATFHIGGLNPILFRFINIFFHTGTVFLIYVLFNILHSKKVAFIVAAIFAVHPAISEAVVWISGGSYPQYTFFFLLSFLFYILSSKKLSFYLLSAIFYLLSFMSHPQMPLPLFIIFPLYELCFGDLKKNWKKSIPFVAIALVYVLIVLTSLPEREATLQSVHYLQKGIDNPFMLIPVAISSYFELIFAPLSLTLYHSELQFSQIEFAIRALAALLLLGLTLFSFKKNKAIFFYLSLFWISLAPTLTPFRLNWIVAERYLYLPILGILAVFALGLVKLNKFIKLRWIDYSLVSLIVLLLSARTNIRNIDWKSEDNLWIATGKTSPSSPNNHNNLGDVYGRWGNKQKALEEFQTAIALKPDYGDAYHNLANTYRELGDKNKALENYQKAIQFNPNLWQSYQNIAALYYEDKQYEQALQFLQKAIQTNPKSINLYNNLAIVYLASGDKEKAKEIFTQVLSADPQNQLARQGLIESSK